MEPPKGGADRSSVVFAGPAAPELNGCGARLYFFNSGAVLTGSSFIYLLGGYYPSLLSISLGPRFSGTDFSVISWLAPRPDL